jgi:serine/threonine protein kinase
VHFCCISKGRYVGLALESDANTARVATEHANPHFPPPHTAIQQQLGIKVGAHLQDGGSKSVYACVLVGGANNGNSVVLAIEATAQAAEPEAVRRLVSRPFHPNIMCGVAHLHAVGMPQTRYTVSERLQVELFDNVISQSYLLQDGTLQEARVRAHFAECVAALRHMHRVGVAHRDITLETIMFSA